MKAIYYDSLYEFIQNRQIHGDRKYISVFHSLGEGENAYGVSL